MKRRWIAAKRLRYQKRRQAYEAARRAEYLKWLRHKRRAAQGRPKEKLLASGERVLKGPVIFSMTRNPDGMNRFLEELLRERDRGHTVFVDLSEIKDLTFDAIAVLLARISEKRFRVGGVRGNEPSDPDLREMLIASGFYGHIQRSIGVDQAGQRGEMIREGGLKAEGAVARQLIQRAKCGPESHLEVYRILVDSMNNTFDHATPSGGRLGQSPVRWWASAYNSRTGGRGHFAFVDNGIGVLESLNVRGVRLLARSIGLHDDHSLLRAVFDGKIASRTDLPNRGHGLPGIKGVAERGVVKNVIVITNGVVADLSRGDYRKLAYPFGGTLLTWEVES
jgi:hypothetical protein